MSDVAISDSAKPIRQEVRGKLRMAIDKMVWEGLEWDEAARQTGFSVRSMRDAFARSHVVAYIRREKQMLRESISPRNIHRLKEIRDAADNMPAVQAIKLLEEMGDDRAGSGAPISQPGVTIVINGLASNATVIDAQANERQPVMHDDRTLDLKANDPRSARDRP